MSNIVDDLRSRGYVSPPRNPADYSKAVPCDLLIRAADEIERLRAVLQRLVDLAESYRERARLAKEQADRTAMENAERPEHVDQ